MKKETFDRIVDEEADRYRKMLEAIFVSSPDEINRDLVLEVYENERTDR